MKIEKKMENGYRLTCRAGHAFTAKRFNLAAECPQCGETAVMIDLVTRYHEDAEPVSWSVTPGQEMPRSQSLARWRGIA